MTANHAPAYDPNRAFVVPHPLYPGQGWDCPVEAMIWMRWKLGILEMGSIETEREQRPVLEQAIRELEAASRKAVA